MPEDLYDRIMEIAVRRGFFWQSYEIYGGVAGFYDLGPLGARVKEKIVQLWKRFFIQQHQELVVEIETPIIAPARVFEASGHLEHFTDPIVECLKCGRKFRADHLVEEVAGIKAEGLTPEELTRIIREKGIRCPVCGGPLSEVKTFNLLFKTTIGPYSENVGYLRPEAAQGMFVAFKRVHEAMRKRMPIGIAQVGRVARNEISPRQGMMRLREFTIAEVEFFFDPEDPGQGGYLDELLGRVADTRIRILRAEDKAKDVEKPVEYKVGEAVEEKVIANPWLAYWMAVARDFVIALGVPYENMYFEEKGPEERAHYSAQTFDQMVKVSRWGWIEVSGHSYRTDYDLSRHMKYSGQDLTVFRQYEKPLTVRRKRVLVDRAWVGRTFRSKAPEIIRAVENLPVDEVEKLVREGKPLEVAGVEIPAEKVKVVEVEEKVTGRRFVPHVVEPSFGIERLLYVVLEYSYSEREGRVVLRLPRNLAPYEAAVFPLTRDSRLVETARRIWRKLVDAGFYVVYDDDGSIGRRYARVDEIGVPVAVTIDYQTLEDGTVTLRDRDTWRQVRVHMDDVVNAVRRYVYEGASLEELGTPVEPGHHGG